MRSLLIALAVTLLIGALAAFLTVRWAFSPVSATSDPVEFEVMPGWGAARVAAELEEHDLIRFASLFTAYLRFENLDRSIGEGLYDLDRSSSVPEIARRLAQGGRPRVVELVVPEGVRAVDIAQRLGSSELGTVEEFEELIGQPGELRPEYVPEDATLEGYLFPASYEFPVHESPEQVLRRMIERFEQELDEELLARVDEAGFSIHEWVTLASLIQSEAGSDQEMPYIAGVFLNRLDVGMPLQSDPPVAYGLGKRMPELDAVAGDMQRDHEWNTYTRGGMPKGPISNPGREALRAALNPIRADDDGREYFYFLHGRENGEPLLRLNFDLEGHNRDIDTYLRGN